jgi:hypothetical protein
MEQCDRSARCRRGPATAGVHGAGGRCSVSSRTDAPAIPGL